MPTPARTPQPPLPPTPASTPSGHRRHRTFSSSSSSSSSPSSLSTASSAASSPSPSPRGAAASCSTTSVPFSWEHHPGIPKTRFFDAASPPTAPLPPPPPLRAPPSAARRGHRRRAVPPCAAANDPFAAALAECTRERSSAASDLGLMDSLFPGSPAAPSRRWSIAAAGGSGFLDLYGCKSAMAVAEGAFILRRPVAVARPGHGRAGQGRPAGRAGGRR